MDTAQLIEKLNSQGVRLWADGDKLRIDAPKGCLTAQLKTDIAADKVGILEYLRPGSGATEDQSTACGLGLKTIGQLIGGDPSALPVVDPQAMAVRLQVTFRPLPAGAVFKPAVLEMRAVLIEHLRKAGVKIIPWERATRPFSFEKAGKRSLVKLLFEKVSPPISAVVRSDIDAVFDVERPVSTLTRIKSWIAERAYQLSSVLSNNGPISISDITRRIGWAEDHAIQRLEDPTATQVVLIKALDETFVDSKTPYINKIGQGVETLISQFSEIVIGASASQISILNMNLSDSVFKKDQLEQFVVRSLIPKLYVPIAPLPLSRFTISEYDSEQSIYAQQLVTLSRSLSTTGLFPAGFKLSEVVRRRSHRDIVSAILNGRTGVSYGFVAYAEPPQYVGPKEISQSVWQDLLPVEHLSTDEVRQTAEGRRYVRTVLADSVAYRQIPDIWLVCSRSGANKTDLNISQDVLRLGLTGSLQLQLPKGNRGSALPNDIRPSYDTYVMVAIALATALYTPDLIEQGAPMIHFHGYPAKNWFGEQEGFSGYNNPAVPCGTYESGVFNFLSIHQLATCQRSPLKLMGLVEPDHGINLLAQNMDYLLSRIGAGVAHSQIELGGRYLPTLRAEDKPRSSERMDLRRDSRMEVCHER